MTLINSNLGLLLAISAFMFSRTTLVAAREVPRAIRYPGHNLASRINADDDGAGMIILFFMDGEMYLGLECCRAIRIITRECWPSMLTSVGFTAEEGDILRGYCDAAPHLAAPRSSPIAMLPPAQAPAQSPYISGPSTAPVVV
ncbi:hypothetical protein MKX03_023920 [Papaver bracteatum]|nr:hypothetical protein MKX03_023920 [Papaver bracteatum]